MRRPGAAAFAAAWLFVAAACERRDGGPVAPEAPARAWRDPSVDPATTRSPSAAPGTTAALIRERDQRRDPSDGRGRAWLDGPSRVEIETPAVWTIVYEAAAPGIAAGGSVDVRIPGTVGWSLPQLRDPAAGGYVFAHTDAPGIRLETALLEGHPLRSVRVGVSGRGLAAGEQIRIDYASRADRVVDTEHFWVLTDGDGDGAAFPIVESPSIETFAAPAERLVAHWPSTARPGETVSLVVAALDRRGNPARLPGPVEITALPSGIDGPVRFDASPETGTVRGALVASGSGVHTVTVRAAGGLAATTNPLRVSSDGPRILWGDVHGHSIVSDGSGTPDGYYRFARDVAGLDVAALTDHDHFGGPHHLDATPANWQALRDAAARFLAPGRFVTLLGFEWTSWLHGHRHVLYFGDQGGVLSSLDARFETPAQLWAGLRGQPVLTFAHHPAGGPIATNWAFAPDPELEPLVEIVSVAGSSEAPDAARPVRDAIDGNFVRDALDGGDRLGFVGSGDSHDGHPGCADSERQKRCGLVAILAEDRTREAVLAALRARRTYATNGPRIVLDVRLDAREMGAVVPPAAESTLRVSVVAPRLLRRVDLVRSGAIVESIDASGRRELAIERPLRDLVSGEYLYVRAVQIDDGTAWSSPFFVQP